MSRFTRVLNLARDALEFVFALGLHVNTTGGRSIYVYQFFFPVDLRGIYDFHSRNASPVGVTKSRIEYLKNAAFRARVPYVT